MTLNLHDDFAVKLMEMIDNGLCVELGMKSIIERKKIVTNSK